MTPKSAASDNNPSGLPPRYEIRRLEEKHIAWAAAIVIHSNLYYSTVWPKLYPEGKTKRALEGFKAADYLIRHQVESGMSFGVFDLEYNYKRAASVHTEGALYWSEMDESNTSDDMLEAMDFPLASVALSYDGINALDMEKLSPILEVLPHFGLYYHYLDELDPRKPEDWKPTGPKQVLMRNATSSRHEYEGQGHMKRLAHFLMREAAHEGYRGIQIEALHDAVIHVWCNPPAPYTGHLISKVPSATFEVEQDGEKVKPFVPATQDACKIYVNL